MGDQERERPKSRARPRRQQLGAGPAVSITKGVGGLHGSKVGEVLKYYGED